MELVHLKSWYNYQASKLGNFLFLRCLAQLCCLPKYCQVLMAFPCPLCGCPLTVTRLHSGMQHAAGGDWRRGFADENCRKKPFLLLLLPFCFLVVSAVKEIVSVNSRALSASKK